MTWRNKRDTSIIIPANGEGLNLEKRTQIIIIFQGYLNRRPMIILPLIKNTC